MVMKMRKNHRFFFGGFGVPICTDMCGGRAMPSTAPSRLLLSCIYGNLERWPVRALDFLVYSRRNWTKRGPIYLATRG
jgi:hypothetical protein